MSPLVRRELGGVNTRAWEHPKGRGSMPRAVGHPEASTSVTLRNTGGQTVVLHRVCPRAPRCERRRASAEGCVCVCPCSAFALVSLVPPPPLVLHQGDVTVYVEWGRCLLC